MTGPDCRPLFLTWKKETNDSQPPLTEGLGLQDWTENSYISSSIEGTEEALKFRTEEALVEEEGTDIQNFTPYPYLRVDWSRLIISALAINPHDLCDQMNCPTYGGLSQLRAGLYPTMHP